MNEAVEIAHTEGVLSAASLMVSGPAAHNAIARARRLRSLRVGLHLVLVEGKPVLPVEQVRDLVDADGNFRTGLFAFGVDIFLRRKVRLQLAAEIEAQLAAFAATGLPLDHLNAHKHFHLHPTVAQLIFDIGSRYRMRSMRVPFEPAAVLARVEPDARRNAVWFSNAWAARLKKQVRRRGLHTPDQVFGVAWSGAMTESRVAGLLQALPDGISEIYLHPAVSNSFAGATRGYRYVDELAALTSPRVRELVDATYARATSGEIGTR